ncbi:hypothetical protein [Telmatospirillum sp.]|uniref:hypothetical protein n=1 Tax=Telmatospirillum sp. TaxID=2079197 RepID=UPI002849D993|nr:hypothetical protein [Telmatospirillum sp.]MDR3438682.1 hypothetical protein [Telmatospirillum sp.]
MRLSVRFFCLLFFAFLPIGPAAADPPLDYKRPPADPPTSGQIGQPEDGHLKGTVPDPLVGPGPFQRLPSIDETLWVVTAISDKPYWTVGKPDPVLTNACRLRDFGSLALNRMVVRFNGEEGRGLLQVVPPTHRHLLIDTRKLSRPDETYYFLNTGLATCEVWFTGKGRPRTLTAKYGTSLPPPDRAALAKKKALINSWPKN